MASLSIDLRLNNNMNTLKILKGDIIRYFKNKMYQILNLLVGGTKTSFKVFDRIKSMLVKVSFQNDY